MSGYFSDFIEISQKYVRSVNIEKDYCNSEIIDGFICPKSYIVALRSISSNLLETGQSAFTFTGPYGSGKSTLALLLSSLLGKNKISRTKASEVIGESEVNVFLNSVSYSKGWEILPIVGDTLDIKQTIELELRKRGKNETASIFEGLEKLAAENDGVLIIIDEMGKTLETAAKGQGDVFFYQQLAEFAARSKKKILLIGILHQSFIDYARSLPYAVRDEWNKIQGRFIDISINTAGEEQFELIGRAIKSAKLDKEVILPTIKAVVSTIANNRPVLSRKDLEQNFNQCYPINPVVICLIAQISKKRFGQNQRSIFSFLFSGEPYGFRDFLNNTEYSPNVLYMPTNFFDYIKTNFESAILATGESKVWHIIIESVQKLEVRGYSELHLNVFKSIAMIDFFSGTSGLTANEDVLIALFAEETGVKKIITDLENEKLILFKKYKNSYSVFEGSDFDLDIAFRDAYKHITALDTSKLNDIADFKPVVAKRFYHQYGPMFWFDVVLSTVDNIENTILNARENSRSEGFFCIILPERNDDGLVVQDFAKEISEHFSMPIVLTVANDSRLIKENLRELIALEWMQSSSNISVLNGDNIAQKVVKDRIDIVIAQLEILMSNTIQDSTWYYRERKYQGLNSQLSVIASIICEEIYSSAPKIKSELLNKNRPSAAANTALNKLLLNMILNKGKKDLDLSGTTTEAGLLKILLIDTKLYKQLEDKTYAFQEPQQDNDLYLLWETTTAFIKNKSYVNAVDVFTIWEVAPYGIKKGLHSFLLLTYILTKMNDIALYRNDIYVTNLDDLFVRYLIKDPKSISIKYIKSDNFSKKVISSVAHALVSTSSFQLTLEPLEIARSLVSFIYGLQPWVLRTKTLSKQTIKIREVLKSASDPYKLLLSDLPCLFEDQDFHEELTKNLNELKNAFTKMVSSIGTLLFKELDAYPISSQNISLLKERAEKIKGISGNFEIEAFIARLSTIKYDIENEKILDLVGIISLANNKPQSEWIDLDIELSKIEIVRLCKEFKKCELYTKIKNKPSSRQAIAFIAGIEGSSEIITEEFSIVDSKTDELNQLMAHMETIIEKIDDKQLILTALSRVAINQIKGVSKNE